jgi:tRNA modification GTPase
MDTIFALSSGMVPAAVAIIRISGPKVRFGLETFIGSLPEPRKAVLRTLRDGHGEAIDRALVLYFPGPHSFTGEDCAEFHVHGGRAVVEALVQGLAALEGFRSAEPGEFTRRAFENGRMDLTEVEGLADLIAAQTEMQRRMALDQSSGTLSMTYDAWRSKLVRARAMIEADFDFADEEDVPGSVSETIWSQMSELALEIGNHLATSAAGEIIRDGYRIVIIGAPNAGKSSLLNTLARRDIAIVSDVIGTTRDVLEVHLDIAGFPVTVFDTAGLRAASGDVEREGMRRAISAARAADLVLVLEDVSNPIAIELEELADRNVLYVGSKIDLGTKGGSCSYDCLISVRERNGIDNLISQIGTRVKEAAGSISGALPNRQRHREYLQKCLVFLTHAIDSPNDPLELRAEELRQSSDMLGRLTGKIDVEDLLDVIFREFCIGK